MTAEYGAAQNSVGLAPMTTVQVTDPGTKIITDQYDPLNSNRMIATIDALGHKTSYGYDTSGFLNTVTDPDGDVTTTGHDVRGNMVSQATCQNQAASACSTLYYTYYPDDTSAQLTTADPRNDMVLTVRDGRSSSATDNTYLTSYAYDAKGDRTGVSTPAVPGFPGGRATAITYSDGTSAYPAADSGNVPAGLPVKTVSPGGAVNQVSYDHDGDVAKTTNADGLTTSYAYDNLGRVLTKTEVSDSYPRGLAASYTYDGQGRVLTETDPPATDRVTGAIHTAQTTTVYDADGNVTSQTVSDLTGGDSPRTVSTTYNPLGEVASSTDANNVTTNYGYDAYGNRIKEVDGNSNEVDSTYDANGDLLTRTLAGYTGDPANPSPPASLVESSRAYDPAGRLASLTDSMGNTTGYTYTDNGLTATITRRNAAGTSSFVEESDLYDAAGNLTQKVTNNGATTTKYTVDAADRTTSTTLDPAGLDRITTVSYTPDDQPGTVTQSDGSSATQVTSATYDPMGNLTSKSLYSDGAGHPAGWWRLNQTSGSVVPDASGTGNTASASSSVTWSGGAASFPGVSGQQIDTNGPVLNTAGSLSVSAWVDLGVVSGWQTFVGQDGAVNSGFNLQLDSTTKKWNLARNDTDATGTAIARAESATAATAGVWTHLVGTYNVSTGAMDIYVNGQLSGTGTATAPWAASGPLTIGRGQISGTPTDFVHGQITDVQVYQRVLSASEVGSLYAGGRSGGTTASSSSLTTSWALDQRGLPTSMMDPDGNVTGYSYDEAGRLAVTTGPAVNAEVAGGTAAPVHPVTSTGYDTFGKPVETQNPDGNVTTTAYDADGNPVSQTLPGYTPPGTSTPITAVSVRQYDNLGQVIADTDPLNNKTAYSYDQLGDLATKTAADGGVTHYTYDANGDQLSGTGPTGAVTQATYDYLGRPLTSTALDRYPAASTSTTTNSYAASASNPGGAWLASSTTQDGVATSYAYDNAGESTALTDGAGNKTSYSYDFLGRQDATRMADGTSSTVAFDQAGDPVTASQLDAAGHVLATQSATYDGVGNRLSATDARLNTTTFTYDATRQLTQEVQPVTATSSITTSFGYDAAGNRTRFTDGRGNPWITTYNTWNLPESVIEPATSSYSTAADSTFTTAYDANGQPVTQTQPGGVAVTAGYDQVGNLTSQAGSGADAPTAARTFGYNLAGEMTSAATSAAGSAPATSESFSYNDRGGLLTAAGTAGPSSFGYNGDGLMTSRTDAAGTTGYTYDGAGRLGTLTDAATGSVLSYSYNQLNQVSQIQYGSGQDVRTYGYDSLHRLTSDALTTAGGATVASISYGYDPNGNLTSKTNTGFAGSVASTYTYDEANRLSSWNNGTTTANYGYDASGNRTQVGANAYTYDARDQLTSDGVNTYAYTARGTLASQTSATGTASSSFDAYGQQVSVGSQAYGYDALGRMVTTAPSGGTATALSYTGPGNTLASDGSSIYSWDPSGGLVGVGAAGAGQSAGVLAFTDLHTDVVGNFTAAGSALAGSASYDPLGNVTAAGGVAAGRLGFQSGWTDPATGQVNMAARWYNPAAGQFTSRDATSVSPVPNPVAANPFAYVDDNPLTRTDPAGASWWGDVTSVVSSGWHYVTAGWDATTSALSRGWDATTSWISSTFDSTLSAIEAEIRVADRELSVLNQEIRDAARALRSATSRAMHTVARVAVHEAHTVIRNVSTTYHEVKTVAKATASFLKHHEAAIVSFAAGAAVFAGCMAITEGVAVVGCAAAAGAVGSLVSYGMSCGSAAGGCTAQGALVSAGVGALGGAVGGALAGPLGGKLASSVLGDVLPGLAVQGLTGATVGAAAGGAAGAAAYGLGCRSSTAGCSWDGLAAATGKTAAGGAITGGILATAGSAAGDAWAGLKGAAGQSCHSFTGSARVLMADGTSKPISRVKAGDRVTDSVPGDDSTQVHTVQKVIVTATDRDFTQLTIQPSRPAGTAARPGTVQRLRGAVAALAGAAVLAAGVTASPASAATAAGGGTLTTTYTHPFYDITQAAFTPARNLHTGDQLQQPGGRTAVITGIRLFHTTQTTYDLTINGLHTYYVIAGTTPVLVHNCGETLDRAIELYPTRTNQRSTVGVARVRPIGSTDPTAEETWVATEQPGLPREWNPEEGGASPLNSGEEYIFGEGHAEETFANAMWVRGYEPVEIGSSTNMCNTCYRGLTSAPWNMVPSDIGSRISSRMNYSNYRLLTRPESQ